MIILYFSNRDDFQAPEQWPDPPKLFRVQRFAPLKHRIYWERKILFDLGLYNDVCIKVSIRRPQKYQKRIVFLLCHRSSYLLYIFCSLYLC